MIDHWLEALHAKHVQPYRPQEFTRALRALSIRYVERRQELRERSPLDSAGKRSAFAAFYAPLHYLTVAEILRALPPASPIKGSIFDLGCGTGVCSAAWSAVAGAPVIGVDANAWSLDEARWNWHQLRIAGQARRGDMTSPIPPNAGALMFGWALNELVRAVRDPLLAPLVTFGTTRGPILIVEPLARGVTPWWNDWSSAFIANGGRADEWKFRVDLPPMLKELSHRAGFHREGLGARSLWLAPRA